MKKYKASIILGIIAVVFGFALFSLTPNAGATKPNFEVIPDNCELECVNYEWQCPDGYGEFFGNKCVKWTHKGPKFKSKVKVCTERELVCEEPEPSVTPTPTPTVPENPPIISDTSNPPIACDAKYVETYPNAAMVKRNGDTAIVQWVPTEGDKVAIYYYQNENPSNSHAVVGDNDGYEEINYLGSLNWTFEIEQKHDCGGGVREVIVDGDTDEWVEFFPSR